MDNNINKLLFAIGDFVVCPGHGVGQVKSIENRELSKEQGEILYYSVEIIANGMSIMVPSNIEDGIRPLVDDQEVEQVFEVLKDHSVDIEHSTWNRRYRDYMNKIKTGSLVEIAEVLRELFILRDKKIKDKKTLSYGEKKMLNQCRDLITQEISISAGRELSSVKDSIDSCFQDIVSS